jgi:hypothetical protein
MWACNLIVGRLRLLFDYDIWACYLVVVWLWYLSLLFGSCLIPTFQLVLWLYSTLIHIRAGYLAVVDSDVGAYSVFVFESAIWACFLVVVWLLYLSFLLVVWLWYLSLLFDSCLALIFNKFFDCDYPNIWSCYLVIFNSDIKRFILLLFDSIWATFFVFVWLW